MYVLCAVLHRILYSRVELLTVKQSAELTNKNVENSALANTARSLTEYHCIQYIQYTVYSVYKYFAFGLNFAEVFTCSKTPQSH